MNFPLTLIDLAGTVALLLWGVRMVQTGIQRRFGPELRRILSVALRHRANAFLAGLGVTAILQSSTATGLMVSGFAAEGLVDLEPALSVMLGANIGTTLIVQALSFDVSSLAPALFLIGVVMFRRGDNTRTRDLGRVAIGLGLMLLSLLQLLEIITPYEDVPSLRMFLGAISTEPVLDVLLAAVLAWAAHSSVAVVLLVMSLAAKGVVPPAAAMALVLGANLGTALNPLLEGGGNTNVAARRLAMGNVFNRLLGVVLALLALPWIGPWMVTLVEGAGREVALFHTAFNVVLALLFFPLLGPFAKLLRRWYPAQVEPDDPGQPRYLGQATLEVPSVAIGGAAREALRMADVLAAMLQCAADALDKGERRTIAEVRRMDDVLDRLNSAIKSYLSGLDPEAMTEADHQRVDEVLGFAHGLEHAGDVVEKNVMGLAAKRMKRGLAMSRPDQAELMELLARLIGNVRTAASVFMTADVRAARLLAAEKEAFRDIEALATQAHFDRLRAGGTDGSDSWALHLDLLRDLKQVNAHLVAAAAYPVLASQGELLSSRLRPDEIVSDDRA